jgi:hypothetical protein
VGCIIDIVGAGGPPRSREPRDPSSAANACLHSEGGPNYGSRHLGRCSPDAHPAAEAKSTRNKLRFGSNSDSTVRDLFVRRDTLWSIENTVLHRVRRFVRPNGRLTLRFNANARVETNFPTLLDALKSSG